VSDALPLVGPEQEFLTDLLGFRAFMSDCVESTDSGATSDQLGGGGANPTSTLGGKAWQRTIREQKATAAPADLFGNWWTAADLSPKNAVVREVGFSEAKPLILDYEWLGTMPSQLSLAVGLYFDNHLSAVECFSETRPAGKYTVAGQPAICLARGASAHWCPSWASSFLIGHSLRLPSLNRFAFCVAYSDTEAGEIGTVYQASNWVCLGPVSRGNKYWLSPDGKRHDHERPRSLARSRDPQFKATKKLNPIIVAEVQAEMQASGWTHVTGGCRYRYAYPLGETKHIRKERRKVLDAISVPYPKRDAKNE
jgi:hypothetical protein